MSPASHLPLPAADFLFPGRKGLEQRALGPLVFLPQGLEGGLRCGAGVGCRALWMWQGAQSLQRTEVRKVRDAVFRVPNVSCIGEADKMK